MDFVLHSIGMSPNVRKGKHYTDINYKFLQTTLDVRPLPHKTLATAKVDALNECSVVGCPTSPRIFPDTETWQMPSLCWRASPEALDTTTVWPRNPCEHGEPITHSDDCRQWGEGFDEFISYSEAMSPLGNADAQSCAEYCITLFSDLTRYVAMQNLFHDGGFSNTGVSMEVISKFGPEEG